MEEMEVPTEKLQEDIEERARESDSVWTSRVALSTAILAVLAAISALLAGHRANEAMIEQITASDQWSYYQAKGIKAEVLESKLQMFAALGKEQPEKDEEKVAEYQKEQKEISEKATEIQNESGHHLKQHNRLADGVALFQVGVAIAAISVLTRRKPLWYLSMTCGLAGLAFFVVGIMH